MRAVVHFALKSRKIRKIKKLLQYWKYSCCNLHFHF